MLAELSGGMDSFFDRLRGGRVATGMKRPHATASIRFSYYDDEEPNWNEKPISLWSKRSAARRPGARSGGFFSLVPRRLWKNRTSPWSLQNWARR
jgi:hypothetical protein